MIMTLFNVKVTHWLLPFWSFHSQYTTPERCSKTSFLLKLDHFCSVKIIYHYETLWNILFSFSYLQFDREHFSEVFVDLKWFESKVGNKYLNEAAGLAAEKEAASNDKTKEEVSGKAPRSHS